MLYFLHGPDIDTSRAKADELIATLLKKKPDAAVFKMEAENFDAARLEELIGGQALFESRFIVLLTRVFENPEAKEVLLQKIKEMAASENIFIFREAAVDAKTAEKIKKAAAKAQEFALKKDGTPAAAPEFNVFSLTDAFGRRDKKSLWVLYEKALMKNVSPEEVHGVLFWQIKAMAAAGESKTAGEAGLKPFVFGKAKRFAANFAPGEIGRLSSSLVSVYHAARSGGPELEIGLERFILEL